MDVARYDHVHIHRRLVEAALWCERHASPDDPQNSLRTPGLQPSVDLSDVPRGAGENPLHSLGMKHAFVENVATRRARLIEPVPANAVDARVLNFKGRVLFYVPDWSDLGGAARDNTESFFWGDDAPPWDTWVWHAPDDEYLLAWIPSIFEDFAEAGIYNDPMGCIGWASDAASWNPELPYLVAKIGLVR